MSYINKINRNNTDYPLVALNSIVTTTSTIDTQIKVGSLDGFTLNNTNQSFKLYLPNGNSVADMKLNLNNLGAKDIKIYKGGVLGSIATTIDVGTIMELFYDGTQFIVIGNPIAQTTSEYTVLMDNTKEYSKTQVDNNLNSALGNYAKVLKDKTNPIQLTQGKQYLILVDCRGTESGGCAFIAQLHATGGNVSFAWSWGNYTISTITATLSTSGVLTLTHSYSHTMHVNCIEFGNFY